MFFLFSKGRSPRPRPSREPQATNQERASERASERRARTSERERASGEGRREERRRAGQGPPKRRRAAKQKRGTAMWQGGAAFASKQGACPTPRLPLGPPPSHLLNNKNESDRNHLIIRRENQHTQQWKTVSQHPTASELLPKSSEKVDSQNPSA